MTYNITIRKCKVPCTGITREMSWKTHLHCWCSGNTLYILHLSCRYLWGEGTFCCAKAYYCCSPTRGHGLKNACWASVWQPWYNVDAVLLWIIRSFEKAPTSLLLEIVGHPEEPLTWHIESSIVECKLQEWSSPQLADGQMGTQILSLETWRSSKYMSVDVATQLNDTSFVICHHHNKLASI